MDVHSDRRIASIKTREKLVELLATADTTVLYDVFADAISTAQARYVHAIVAARSEAERHLWTDRSIALNRFRHAVGPDDRDAMIDGLMLLNAERPVRTLNDDARAR